MAVTRAFKRSQGGAGDEVFIDADLDTSITADTDDQIDIKVAGADDFKITANTFSALDGSSVLIGGGSSRTVGGVTAALQVEGTAINDSSISMISNGASGTDGLPAKLVFGRSGAASLGSSTVVEADNEIGVISFQAADGTDLESQAASIFVAVDGTPGGNDTPGRMMFATCADGSAGATERMRIKSTGEILLGKTTNGFTAAGGCFNDTGSKNGSLELIMDGGVALALNRLSNNGSTVTFHQNSTGVGSIGVTGSNTSFNTSSDYRLKENVDYSWDATTRLKQLKPARFNFIIDDTNTLQDGFLAHEVSSIVPEAITGAKDATIDIDVVKNASGKIISCTTMDTSEEAWIEGKDDEIFPSNSTWHENETVPDYQNIDHSRLVPLLVKTIQELEARIAALES